MLGLHEHHSHEHHHWITQTFCHHRDSPGHDVGTSIVGAAFVGTALANPNPAAASPLKVNLLGPAIVGVAVAGAVNAGDAAPTVSLSHTVPGVLLTVAAGPCT